MDLLAALALQLEWGADEALVDVALDRLAPPRPAASRTAAPQPASLKPPARPASATAAPASDALPGEMAALLEAYAGFGGCALRATATNFVRPEGDPDAGLVWLTGPPAAEDDRSGRPVSGPEGALLDRLLASIGLQRGALLLVPIVPWRPPGGRPPSAAEVAQCMPFLHRLLALAQPHTLVLEAGVPAQALLPRGSGRARRAVLPLAAVTLPERAEPVAALSLPSLGGIRQSAERRREAWEQLRRLRRHLDVGLPKNSR